MNKVITIVYLNLHKCLSYDILVLYMKKIAYGFHLLIRQSRYVLKNL